MAKQSWDSGFFENRSWLGIPTYTYSGGVPTTLVDPRTGLPATGVPTYSTLAALEAAYTAASNTYLVGIVTGVHDRGTTGGSLWKSNGSVYMPVNAPIYTQAAAESAFSSAPYTGIHITFSDVGLAGGAEHIYDGTNWVPVQGRCTISNSATQLKFAAPVSGANGVVSSIAPVSGNLYDLTFAGGHGLTTAAVLNCYLVVKTAGNGWTAGQRMKLTAITDGGNVVRVDSLVAGSYGVPTVARVGEEFIMEQVTIPKLHGKSGIDFVATVGCSPIVGVKSLVIRLNSPSSNTMLSTGISVYGSNIDIGFRNQNNSASAQVGKGSTASTGTGAVANTVPFTLTVDTSSSTIMYVNSNFQTTVNEMISIERWELHKIG